MWIPLEIAQNLLMGFEPVAMLARRRHSTGVNADPIKVREVFERYGRFSPVSGKDILEIGPGHTLEVLAQAKSDGANSCTAIDIVDYRSSDQAGCEGVTFMRYDGRTIPLASASCDLIWSHTAFEHLRFPGQTVKECFRVLRPGGSLIAVIDLGDHACYGTVPPQPDKVFDCLRYPEWLWNLMRWNRSSYVNRLRQSEWLDLLGREGFFIRGKETAVSEDTVRLLPSLRYLHKYRHEDAVTSLLTVCCDKPHTSAAEAVQQWP
jgi:SAM-dependent methyltransferase